MARRATKVRKQKTVRVSRSQEFLINQKHMGDEPIFANELTNIDYIKSLNWYSVMCNNTDAREYIETYLKNVNRIGELKSFKRVPDVWINPTSGWIARMRSRGLKLPETSNSFFETKLKDMISHAKQEEKVVDKETSKVSVQDRIRERTLDIIGDIEEKIDSNEPFSLYDYLKSKEIPSVYMNAVIEHYSPWLDELIEAYEGKDEQLKEAYRHHTKKTLRDRIDFINNIIQDAEKYGSVTKKTRAPRKPRAVSVEKKLKGLKFQKEDNNYKIASVNPEKIIGAQELWTFNTKYKILTVFRALDRGGLQVKGTSIINYDETSSVSKRTGRKPEEYVKKVLSNGKLVLRRMLEEMKADAPLAHRINENTILLKIT